MPTLRRAVLVGVCLLAAIHTAPAQDGCEPWFKHPQIDGFYPGGLALIDLQPSREPVIVGNASSRGLELWRFGPQGAVIQLDTISADLGHGMFAADFDNDGDTDILAKLSSGDAVGIFENTAGTLLEGPRTAITDLYQLHIAADYNADALPDLVVSTGLDILMLRNAGDGTFEESARLRWQNINGMLPATFERDGLPGLLVMTPHWVVPVRQHSDGSLEMLEPIPIDGARVDNLLAGDINGDGLTDMLYEGRQVLFGQGLGEFVEGPALDPRVVALSKLVDIDLDGDLDLLANAANSSGTFITAYTLLNDGSGLFSLQEHSQHVSPHRPPTETLVEDVNGDGLLDIVAQRQGLIDLRLGSGVGHFDGVPLQLFFEEGLRRAVLGDLDNDGDLDILANGDDPDSVLKVLLNDGTGSFAIAAAMVAPSVVFERTPLADFDADGDLDILAWTGQYGLWIYENTPDGFFSQVHVIPHRGGGRAAIPFISDVNRDGLLDIVAGDDEGDARGYSTYFNWGDWEFRPRFTEAPEADHVLAMADFNNDGRKDLLCADTANPEGELRIAYATQFTNFTDPEPTGALAPEDPFAMPGDFNGDGWRDFVIYGWLTRDLRVMTNQRDGSFLHTATLDRFFAPRDPGVLDLDGDGFDELVCTSQDSDRGLAAVCRFNAFGEVIEQKRFGIGFGALLGSPVGDLNGDGAADVLLVAKQNLFGPGGVSVCANPCPGPPCLPDLNNDGSVNTQDFIAYLDRWAAQRGDDCSDYNCSADLDRNGLIDTRDLVRFLAAWAAGC